MLIGFRGSEVHTLLTITLCGSKLQQRDNNAEEDSSLHGAGKSVFQ
jgi:hypothetical protein